MYHRNRWFTSSKWWIFPSFFVNVLTRPYICHVPHPTWHPEIPKVDPSNWVISYPLVNVYKKRWKDPTFFSWVNQLFLWAIFNSYVKLPRRVCCIHILLYILLYYYIISWYPIKKWFCLSFCPIISLLYPYYVYYMSIIVIIKPIIYIYIHIYISCCILWSHVRYPNFVILVYPNIFLLIQIISCYILFNFIFIFLIVTIDPTFIIDDSPASPSTKDRPSPVTRKRPS